MRYCRVQFFVMVLVLMLAQVRAFASFSQGEIYKLLETSMALVGQGKSLEAIEPIEQLLSADPDDPMVLYYSAIVMGSLGEINAAIYFYNQAVKGGYAGEADRPDQVGENLRQYELREFALDVTSLNGERRTVNIKGNTGADNVLAADALRQIDRMKEIYGLSDFREVYANFIAWLSADSFYERWRIPSGGKSVYLWVTFKTNLPADAPTKSLIEISDSDGRILPVELSNILKLIPSEKVFTLISSKEAEAVRVAMPKRAVQTDVVRNPDLIKARGLVDTGNCSQALPLLESVIRDEPTNIDGYWERAYCQKKLKNYQAAIKDYYKILTMDPQAADAYLSLEVIYVEMGNTSQAQGVLWNYIQMRPNDGEAWYAMATMTMNPDDLKRAKELGAQDKLRLEEKLIAREKLQKIAAQGPMFHLVKLILGLFGFLLIMICQMWKTPTNPKRMSQEQIDDTYKKMARIAQVIFLTASICVLPIVLANIYVNHKTISLDWLEFISEPSVWSLTLAIYVICGFVALIFYVTLWVAIAKANGFQALFTRQPLKLSKPDDMDQEAYGTVQTTLNKIEMMPAPDMTKSEIDSTIWGGWVMAAMLGLFAYLTPPITEMLTDGKSKGPWYLPAAFLLGAVFFIYHSVRSRGRSRQLANKIKELAAKRKDLDTKIDGFFNRSAELIAQIELAETSGERQRLAELNVLADQNQKDIEYWSQKRDALSNEMLVLEFGKLEAKSIVRAGMAQEHDKNL